jgi:hypothetical protein
MRSCNVTSADASWVEDCDLDVQRDQGSQTVNIFSKVDRFGVDIDFFDFGVGSHHGERAPERIGSTASGIRYALGMWGS